MKAHRIGVKLEKEIRMKTYVLTLSKVFLLIIAEKANQPISELHSIQVSHSRKMQIHSASFRSCIPFGRTMSYGQSVSSKSSEAKLNSLFVNGRESHIIVSRNLSAISRKPMVSEFRRWWLQDAQPFIRNS